MRHQRGRCDAWANLRRVQEHERRTGRPFSEIVLEMRRKHPAADLPGLLGVSRHFLYDRYGHVMDRVACIERLAGKSLGEVVMDCRRAGLSMREISAQLGLAVSTLYNHLAKAPGHG